MQRLFILTLLLCANQAFSQIKFDVQGNRGARGILPENTIPSAKKALELGASTVSINVVISKDKQVIVSYVPYFNHEITTLENGKSIRLEDEKKYNIYQMTYAEIKKIDVGQKTHPRFLGQQKIDASKPLLSELIDSVEWYVKKNKLPKPMYNIETKTIPKGDYIFQPDSAEYVELIMNIVKQKKLSARVIIQSFDLRTLRYLHKQYPKIKTSLLIDEKENLEKNLQELGFTPTIYSPYYVLVGKSLVDRCHNLGIKIIPWTVNSAKEISYLKSLGVDGIITDYPNLMRIVAEN